MKYWHQLVLAPVAPTQMSFSKQLFAKLVSELLLVCLSFLLARMYQSANSEPPRTRIKIVQKTVTLKGFVARQVKFLGS